MNKYLPVFVLACCCTIANAQSSVTLYGSLDVGVGYFNNAGAGRKVTTVSTMQPDRFGLLGVEDLGGGTKAVFRLESGFFTTTGAMAASSIIFNRQAYVGLSSNVFGTLTLGRQTPFNYDWLGPLSTAYLAADWYMFHPGNIDELAGTSVVQYQNSVKYISPSWAGLTVGAMFGLGNTTNFAYGRNYSLGLNYVLGTFKAGAAYSDETNRTPLVASVGLTTFQGVPAATYSADRVKNIGAGASGEIGPFTLHGLFTLVQLQSGQRSDIYQSYDAGVTYKATPANFITGGVSTTRFVGSRYTEFALGDNCALSKSTQIYADVLYETVSGGAKADIYTIGASSTSRQLGFLAGIHHSF